MRRAVLLAMVLSLIPAVSFATGQTDKGKAVGTAAAATIDQPGKVVLYATLADYEKETGKKIAKFSEAPMLAKAVAEGKLPPLDKRLPAEPLVLKPLNSIGKYGGRVRCSATSPTTGGAEAWTLRTQPLFRTVPTDKGDLIVPNVAKGWKLSPDYKTLTVYLRKGMKWSDGAPFTADDFVFWGEDVIGNKEIVSVPSKIWTPGGQLVKVSKVDDLTVRFDFAVPYPSIVTFLAYEARMYYSIPFAPKHYLRQFHTKYNPDAGKVAKEKNYDTWEKYFQYIYPDEVQRRYDVKVPTVDAWTMTEVDKQGNKYFDRNPYYFKIDTAGDQLPYIDRQERLLFANVESINLTAIAGGLDYSQQDLVVENFAMYKQNEAQGKYKVSMWFDGRGQVLTDLRLNLNHPDPVMRQLMNTLKFRQALSLAINRQEVNEAIFSGLATPRQATVRDDVSFYEDWMGKYFAEYDAPRANKLLDEIGLKWDAAKKVRLRPDGKPLELRLEYVEMEGPRGRICELVKEYFQAIGIQTTIKQLEQNLWNQRGTAGELDIDIWNLDATNEIGFHADTFTFRPYANDWWRWYNTGGKSGTEPPPEVKQFFALCEKFQALPFGSEEYRKVAKELVTLHLNNLWHVGIFGNMPKPTIIKAGLRNTPEKGLRMYAGYRFWMVYNGDQWYWENPE